MFRCRSSLISAGLLAVVLLSAAERGEARPRLSAYARALLVRDCEAVPARKATATPRMVDVLLLVRPPVDADALAALAARLGTRTARVWTARVPLGALAALAEVGGVEYVDVGLPVFPAMEAVRAFSGIDAVHAGAVPPGATTGRGVIVGVVDGGFDLGHPASTDASGALATGSVRTTARPCWTWLWRT